MNTNTLKKFAQEARKKLIEQIGAKLELVMSYKASTLPSELREKASQLKKLQEAINATSKTQVIDKVAYTWFNRLMALRFMDANDYQPLGVRVVTPKENYTLPEILDEAKQGNIPDDLPINQQQVYDILDGKIPSSNAQNEAYKELLIGACNHLHIVFPFLFEKINNYSELLLPDDLISEFSIVQDIREGMTTEDCQEVEIIGWLYQFYISERKDEVFASKGKVEKEDIPAATQLFTPRWIVEYMVQNTVGKLWLQNNPNSNLREHMPYFIASPSVESDDYLKINSVEEITLLDQACGSGHVLVYGFELLTKIYEEQGYNPSEIPQLIIEKNLFGFEIDERAAQLAGLALMMKARSYHRRVFRKELKPNILCYKDIYFEVFGENGNKETFKVKNEEKAIQQYLNYGYRIAEKIEKVWDHEYVDKKTGQSKTVQKKKTLLRKYTNTSPDDLEDILLFGNEEILFCVDEIKDVFRSAKIDLSRPLYLDLKLILQATNFGSLIIPKTPESAIKNSIASVNQALTTNDYFLKNSLTQIKEALEQLLPLSRKYHCVVDNPPYMGGGNMNKELATFVKANYKDSKSDLMACFMEAGLKTLQSKGFLGMINQHSWMFLSSYEKLRGKLIRNISFDTLLHLGARTFPEIGGEVVQNASFTFWNTSKGEKGSYIRLVDDDNSELKRTKTLEAIQNPDFGWFYTANQNDFEKIPGSPIGYWLNSKILNQFSFRKVSEIADTRSGMSTSDNKRFLRLWSEVSQIKVNKIDQDPNNKWVFIQRGGGFRRWYGLATDVINWENNGFEIKEYASKLYGSYSRTIKSLSHIFREGITWSYITSGKFSARKFYKGTIFINAGPAAFLNEPKDEIELLGYLNCKISEVYLKLLSPTLNYDAGPVSKIPYEASDKSELKSYVQASLEISKQEWNSRENSWDFNQNELLRIKGQDLEEAYDLYQQYWKNKFHQLHKNEEELNRQFIEIYGLEEELTPDVALEDITILKNETKIINNQLVFQEKEVFAQFMSYAVGCMFGRYSLDKEGLILANQGETLADYLSKVELSETEVSFLPDDDNIIPILDDEWFEDDIINRFYEFLKVSFGEANFSKNVAFVEDCLGKDVRKYFVKDFYKDHIKRYKKRPIYWQFSSPKGSFNVLIYMHRYTQDTLNQILNGYLKEYREKLKVHIEYLESVMVSGSSSEQNKASKKKDKLKVIINELIEYERDVLYPMATDRIPIDLDDGVLVNYNKFGTAIKKVTGLNDKKAKEKVRKFDWIDVNTIR